MWWLYVIVVVAIVFAVYAFASLAGFQTRLLSRRSDRRAEDLYDDYADPPSNQPPPADPEER